MTKFGFSALAAAALVAVPALAAQQGDTRRGAQPLTAAAFQARVEARFAATDANRDGFIAQAEAQARAGAGAERREAREQRRAKRAERLARLDTDRDGTISAAERQAQLAARGLDQAEVQAKRAERRALRAERRAERKEMRAGRTLRIGDKRFARLDADKDGRLSLAEVTARSAVRFQRLDANKDGALTREERRSARAERQARRNG